MCVYVCVWVREKGEERNQEQTRDLFLKIYSLIGLAFLLNAWFAIAENWPSKAALLRHKLLPPHPNSSLTPAILASSRGVPSLAHPLPPFYSGHSRNTDFCWLDCLSLSQPSLWLPPSTEKSTQAGRGYAKSPKVAQLAKVRTGLVLIAIFVGLEKLGA